MSAKSCHGTMFSSNELEPFFLKAMRDGYASDAPHEIITELPGSKVIRFQDGKFKLHDVWHTGLASRKSFGTTIISFAGTPVWMMQYYGRYPKEVLLTLKRALTAGYREKFPRDYDPVFFLGCRGPRLFEGVRDLELEKSFAHIYVNMPAPGSTFFDFRGREEIINTETNPYVVGWHEYVGMMLT